MNMKKKGFTLIELLAVIAILTILSLIVVYFLGPTITDSEDNNIKVSVKNYITAIENNILNYKLQNINVQDGNYSVMNNGNVCLGELSDNVCSGDILDLELKEGKPIAGTVVIQNRSVIGIVDLNINQRIVSWGSDGIIIEDDETLNPPVITLKSATSTSNSITLNYDVATKIGIKEYKCIYGINDEYGSVGVSTSTSCKLNDLVENQLYYYKIIVTDLSGNESFLTGSMRAGDIIAPEIVVSPSGYATSKVATISYNDSKISSPEYYFYSTISGDSDVEVYYCGIDSSAPGKCNSEKITKIQPNTWYRTTSTKVKITYKDNGSLIARISDGTNYKASTQASITGIDKENPIIIINSISRNTDNILINYTAEDDQGIESYKCVYGKDKNYGSVATTTSSSCTMNNLDETSTYYYKIIVTDVVGKTTVKEGRVLPGILIVTLEKTSYTYDGTAKTPSVIVTDGDETLKLGTDYTVTYSNNINAGIATVTIIGIGNYTKTVEKTFTINKAISTCSMDLPDLTYPGATTQTASYACIGDGTLSVTSSDTKVIEIGAVTEEEIPVVAKKIGTSTITLTMSEGTNYKAADFEYGINVEGTIYDITLNNNNATTSGTTTIYQKYGTGYYLEKDDLLMSSTGNNIDVPTKTSYVFNGYYSSSFGGTKYIDENGYIMSTAPTTLSSSTTFYAQYTAANYLNVDTGEYFITLSDALNSSFAGDTIQLLNNYTDTSSLTFNKDITFDTNGKTLTRTDTINVAQEATLTIIGSGTITSATAGINLFSVQGTLNIGTEEEVFTGTISRTNDADDSKYVLATSGTGTINVYGGTFTATNRGMYILGSLNYYSGTLTVSDNYAVQIATSGTAVFNGGTITAVNDLAIFQYTTGTVSINGTNVTSTNGRAIYSNRSVDGVQEVGTLNISKGSITTGKTISVYGELNMSGGTISAVTPESSTANISALSYYGSSMTMTGGAILKQASANAGPVFNNNGTGTVTLKSGGIVMVPGENSSNVVVNASTGTINLNGAVVNNVANGPAVTNSGAGTINVNLGTITSSSSYGLVNSSTGKINVNGGTITSYNYAIRNTSTGVITVGEDDGEVSTTMPKLVRTTDGKVAYTTESNPIYIYDGYFQKVGYPNVIMDPGSDATKYYILLEGYTLNQTVNSSEGTSSAVLSPSGPYLKVNVTDGTTYAKSKTATFTIGTGATSLTAGTYTIKYAWGTSAVACADMTSTTTITVASGSQSATSGSVTISGKTGSGRLYACNVEKITDSNSKSIAANTRTQTAMYLDATSPTLSVSVSNGTTYAKSKTATIKISDNISLAAGTYTIKYAWGTSAVACADMTSSTSLTVEEGETNVSKTVTISGKTGAGKIYICNSTAIKDTVENSRAASTVASASMYLDNTAPTITYSLSSPTPYSDGYVSPLKIIATCKDSNSGVSSFVVKDAQYTSDSTSNTTGASITKSLVTQGTSRNVTSTCKDAAGNSATKASSTYKIYKEIKITYNSNGATSIGKTEETKYTTSTSGASFTMPSITRTQPSTVIGWATSKDATSKNYTIGSSYTFSSSRTLYAVTSAQVVVNFSKGSATSVTPSQKSCTLYNTGSCYITMPKVEGTCNASWLFRKNSTSGEVYGPPETSRTFTISDYGITLVASCG